MAAQKGYRLLLVIPDKMSQEKIFHLRAMGAEVMMTRSDVSKGHPEYYRDVAERLAREIPDSYFVNQFGNPANAQAHEETTAPEIWEQMGHELRRRGVRRRHRRHARGPDALLRAHRAARGHGARRSRRLRAGELRRPADGCRRR